MVQDPMTHHEGEQGGEDQRLDHHRGRTGDDVPLIEPLEFLEEELDAPPVPRSRSGAAPLHERAESRARANVAQAAGFRHGGRVGLTFERG